MFLFSLFALATITSCSNDDDNSSASIEGKWEFSQQGETLTTLEAVETYSCGKDFVIFSQRGNVTSTFYYYNADQQCTSGTETATWTKTNNALTIKYDSDQEDVYEIIELTDHKLVTKEVDEEGIWFSIYIKK